MLSSQAFPGQYRRTSRRLFLVPKAGATSAPTDGQERTLTEIGPEPVKRLVAVKLIKAGMDSKQIIARFEAERQALGTAPLPDSTRRATNPPTARATAPETPSRSFNEQHITAVIRPRNAPPGSGLAAGKEKQRQTVQDLV